MDIAVVRLKYLVIDHMGKLPCKNVGQGENWFIGIFKVKDYKKTLLSCPIKTAFILYIYIYIYQNYNLRYESSIFCSDGYPVEPCW